MCSIDISSLVNITSALIAIFSAFYAFQQSKAAKDSVKQAEASVKEALAQNRISALLVLKEHLEKRLPEIRKMADHFCDMPEGLALDEEHEDTRKRLQKVNREIDALYDLYVPPKG